MMLGVFFQGTLQDILIIKHISIHQEVAMHLLYFPSKTII